MICSVVAERGLKKDCCAMIAPVSVPLSIMMRVCPMVRSPFRSVCGMGQGPRQRGSKEGWRLRQCFVGRARKEGGNKRP